MTLRFALAVCAAAATVHSVAGAALAAVPAWAVGTWTGRIEDGTTSSARADRVLIVRANGKCHWDIPAKDKPAGAACTISARTLTLTTSSGAAVKFQFANEKLEGSFQDTGGRSFSITMRKQ